MHLTSLLVKQQKIKTAMKNLSHDTNCKLTYFLHRWEKKKKILILEVNAFKLNLLILCNSPATKMSRYNCSSVVSYYS